MELDAAVIEYMDAQGGLLNAADLRQIGYSRGMLYVYARAGLLERYACGIYARPGSLVDDMAYLQKKFPAAVFSHESALYLNGLAERTPFRHSVTIPSDATLPRSVSAECCCFYVRPQWHALGITERQTPLGNAVRCYDAERTVCDILRKRNRLDIETYTAGLKLYFARKDKDLPRLAQYAATLGVLNKLTPYLEVLV